MLDGPDHELAEWAVDARDAMFEECQRRELLRVRLAACEALVRRFRGRADFMTDEGGCGEAIELQRCANELEAVRRGEVDDAKR